jgi:hypothetical protein
LQTNAVLFAIGCISFFLFLAIHPHQMPRVRIDSNRDLLNDLTIFVHFEAPQKTPESPLQAPCVFQIGRLNPSLHLGVLRIGMA